MSVIQDEEGRRDSGQRRRREHGLLVPLGAALVVLVLLTEEVAEKEAFGWDNSILAELRGIESALLDVVLGAATSLGGGIGMLVLLIPLMAFLVARDRLMSALFVAAAVFGARLVGAVMKDALNRPRPPGGDVMSLGAKSVTLALAALVIVSCCAVVWKRYRQPRIAVAAAVLLILTVLAAIGLSFVPDVVGSDHRSFPSGHATASMALAIAAGLALWNTRLRWPTIVAGAVLVAGVGLSRVYFGVHYPSDIIGGWCLAVICVTFAWIVFKPWLRAANTPPGPNGWARSS